MITVDGGIDLEGGKMSSKENKVIEHESNS